MNKIIIENTKGSYKSFEIENDPIWKEYPLKGVTYPVDYGHIEGYKSEDDQDLDIFVGTGSLNGYIKVWRCDTPIETKIVSSVTEEEWNNIIAAFNPVLKDQHMCSTQEEFDSVLDQFKNNN